MSRPLAHRRGAILIIVVGLAMLLLSLVLTFLYAVRSQRGDVDVIIRDVQTRAMLIAGMNYVAECSRLGWGDIETCGWNDVRNHAVGPIPREVPGTPHPEDAVTATQDGVPIPRHAVWAALGAWPAPGGSARVPMHMRRAPPFAMRLGAQNELRIRREPSPSGPDEPIPSGGYFQQDGDQLMGVGFADATRNVTAGLANHGQNMGFVPSFEKPEPAPLFASAADVISGDPTPVPSSTGLAWFRVYRELPGDHDGDGNPYFDVVDLNGAGGPPNASVFIITCGAGPTMGFRDWAEIVAAGAASTFGNDEALFHLLRREEVVLWYRVEWSPFTHGNDMPWGRTIFQQQSGTVFKKEIQGGDSYTGPPPTAAPFGTFRWVQRLDREPRRNGEGAPLW